MRALRAVTLLNTEPSNVVAARPTLIGQTLGGRYRVECLLGSGGMGSVYRAIEESLGRPVAIKVLHSEMGAEQSTLLERFEREASTLARLAHPHIVTIYDYGATERGDLFLVMEYLAGATLRVVIRDGGPMQEAVAISIAAQVGRALRNAHAQGVLHRDIKPDNIMVVSHDDELVIKLVDFGVAKFFEPSPGCSRARDWLELTHTGSMIGSPAYMAPEQVYGGELGQWTDIYSLGATLFHMLAGEPPFSGGTSYEVIQKHVHEPAPRIRDVSPRVDCGEDLERIVHRCLEKRPEDRFESVDALLGALSHLWEQRQAIVPSLGFESHAICFDSGVVSAQLPLQTEIIEGRKHRRDESSLRRQRPSRRSSAIEWSWKHWALLFAVGCFWGVLFTNVMSRREPPPVISAPLVTDLEDPGLSQSPELTRAQPRPSVPKPTPMHAKESISRVERPSRGDRVAQGRSRAKKRAARRASKRAREVEAQRVEVEEFKANPF